MPLTRELGQVKQLESRLLQLLHVPVTIVVEAFTGLPLPGNAVGVLVFPLDETILDISFYNNGSAGGNVYFRNVQNVVAAASFIIPPQAAYNPPFPPTQALWFAGDAGHDLRVVRLNISASARRSVIQY